MNRDEKIDKIYEAIADKTLSFGCRITYSNWVDVPFEYVLQNNDIISKWIWLSWKVEELMIWDWFIITEIIWHPVMIWDVLDWLEKDLEKFYKAFDNDKTSIYDFMSKREYKRKPIEEQSDECIDFIYNLLQ